jgi:hypothetical protein
MVKSHKIGTIRSQAPNNENINNNQFKEKIQRLDGSGFESFG